MEKSQLRRLFLAKRKDINSIALKTRSQAISQTFFQHFDLLDINSLHVFLPIQKQHEIDTQFIIQTIQQNYPHIALVVPKADWRSCTIESYLLTPQTKLVENHWNIPEPVDAEKFPHQEIDLVILPLLCFDKQGVRVGYGKGFYDRFLADCRPSVIKVGLSLFDPVMSISEVTEKDIKMDFCVLENKVFCFSQL